MGRQCLDLLNVGDMEVLRYIFMLLANIFIVRQ